ncbi:unnamed protein product [Closterium sp. Naga37s-1]|nr:unnamed protein product [Closterium sp. Naga37s-1]
MGDNGGLLSTRRGEKKFEAAAKLGTKPAHLEWSEVVDALSFVTEDNMDLILEYMLLENELRRASPSHRQQHMLIVGLTAHMLIVGLTAHMLIVGLTAHNMAEYGDLCTEAGMDAYATKPFKTPALVALILETIKHLKGQLASKGASPAPPGYPAAGGGAGGGNGGGGGGGRKVEGSRSSNAVVGGGGGGDGGGGASARSSRSEGSTSFTATHSASAASAGSGGTAVSGSNTGAPPPSVPAASVWV